MSVKSSIRSVLPVTTRDFEHWSSSLREQIDATKDAASELHEQSTQEIRALQESFDPLHDAFRAVQDRFDALDAHLNKPSYCNLEYLSLNREHTGRRILLAGWYGASNCGDELMMRTMLQHFEKRGVRVSVLLWDDPDYDFSRLPACADQIHYPRSTWELRQLAEYFDVLVWGGGAIIDDRQFNHNPLNINTGNLLVWLSEEMFKREKEVYAVGLSANESLEADTEYARRLAAVIAGCAHVSLRDSYSLEALTTAGIDVSRIELCEDIVFGNRFIGASKTTAGDAPPAVGVTLMTGDVTNEHNRLVLPHIIEMAKGRYGEGCRIKLVPFYNFWKFDTTLLTQLCEELGVMEQVEIVPYTDELQEIGLLDCDVVIAYRYHACLIAAASGIPTLFMCVDDHPHYRNKMRRIAEVFGMSDNLLMASTCLDDGSFDARFGALLEAPVTPSIPENLFQETFDFLERVCASAVEPRA
ncbi:polysaccharide pyruvyl transferase family protein [Collinsella sp. zg1085]|uniref:polysaccharide pyruvyl transferase family protein n=1 Tax=Collinsella sp. zg1085 TaxID=2844380 RepID=UPI001C0E1214|nr:polysaccharide pyruvyl transferase family protein [Collinsella sp. zg1085]QWT17565.1 polysaccharide pyruvyl transferase family protein [Collinsella sp. zg1085]